MPATPGRQWALPEEYGRAEPVDHSPARPAWIFVWLSILIPPFAVVAWTLGLIHMWRRSQRGVAAQREAFAIFIASIVAAAFGVAFQALLWGLWT